MSLADDLERESWEWGPSAFWLDPDRWHGVDDPRRDMLWMHLDERPAPVVLKPRRPIPFRLEPGAINVVGRHDRVLELLARANDHEEAGGRNADLIRRMAVKEARRGARR